MIKYVRCVDGSRCFQNVYEKFLLRTSSTTAAAAAFIFDLYDEIFSKKENSMLHTIEYETADAEPGFRYISFQLFLLLFFTYSFPFLYSLIQHSDTEQFFNASIALRESDRQQKWNHNDRGHHQLTSN